MLILDFENFQFLLENIISHFYEIAYFSTVEDGHPKSNPLAFSSDLFRHEFFGQKRTRIWSWHSLHTIQRVEETT